jgi:hypothetical protein
MRRAMSIVVPSTRDSWRGRGAGGHDNATATTTTTTTTYDSSQSHSHSHSSSWHRRWRNSDGNTTPPRRGMPKMPRRATMRRSSMTTSTTTTSASATTTTTTTTTSYYSTAYAAMDDDDDWPFRRLLRSRRFHISRRWTDSSAAMLFSKWHGGAALSSFWRVFFCLVLPRAPTQTQVRYSAIPKVCT